MKIWIALFVAFAALSEVCAQEPTSTLEEYEERYARRIRQTYLNEVYIPEDLGDAIVQFNKLISPESKQKFKAMSEADAATKLHFSFGRWIIINWGFYEGSRFSHYLKQLGLSHPDDMARFVVVCYHRNLNKKPLEPKVLIAELVETRRAAYQEKMAKQRRVISETRIPATSRDTTKSGGSKP
jgi:hypothetical protein